MNKLCWRSFQLYLSFQIAVLISDALRAATVNWIWSLFGSIPMCFTHILWMQMCVCEFKKPIITVIQELSKNFRHWKSFGSIVLRMNHKCVINFQRFSSLSLSLFHPYSGAHSFIQSSVQTNVLINPLLNA